MDRLSVSFAEDELVEMVQGNLLIDMKERLLFENISSISELRHLVHKREHFLREVGRTRPQQAKSTPYRVYALDEEQSKETPEGEEELEIAAINRATPLLCWNCEAPGHVWENCLAERRVFCYGCGAPQIYKPNCQNCKKQAENRQGGASNPGRMSHK